MKGLLILLIMLGHNYLFSHHYPLYFSALYNFHVACFLLLPFLFGAPNRLLGRLWGYARPHLLFFVVAAVAYGAIYVTWSAVGIVDWSRRLSWALLLSSEGAYREAVGFGFFWFLPALAALTTLRYLWGRLRRGGRWVLSAALLAGHLGLGILSAKQLASVPFGLPLVIYLFLLGVIVGILWRCCAGNHWFRWGSVVLFAGCFYLGIWMRSFASLAGDLDPRLPDILEPGRLLFHDLYLIAAFFAILSLAKLADSRLLRYLGASSLALFLIHPFVWQVLQRGGVIGWIDGIVGGWQAILATLGFTLILSVAVAELLRRMPLFGVALFPRSRRMEAASTG